MRLRVLVTGASGDIGDAVGRILAELDGIEAFGADAGDPWPGAFIYGRVHRLPLASDPGYLDELQDLRETLDADLILPLTEPELSVLATTAGHDLPLLWVGAQIVETFLDKSATARWLEQEGFPAPRTTTLREATGDDLPVIIKPTSGSGGRGVRLVREMWELDGLQRSHPDPARVIVQELLLPDDGEVTCAVVRLHGETRTVQLLRTLSGGLTARATVIDDRDIERFLVALAERTGLEGCINVQLRMTAAGPRIFEVNPRLSSTVRMRHCIGFRDLEWWLQAAESEPVPHFSPPVGTRIFRLSRELVVEP